MSPRGVRDRVEDMFEAAAEAVALVGDKSEDEFTGDRACFLGVLYCFVVLGEASVGVPEGFRELHGGVPWREMRGMRNVLTHAYFGVDAGRVYMTVKQDLPGLIVALERILDDPGLEG